MKIGMLIAANEHTADPGMLGRKMEELGFESIWLPDHPVLPVHTTTPLPETQPGHGEIPEVYAHISDPFVGMAMAAGATTTLKVATGVCLVPERNPLLTANELASLDHFSEGRVLFGIGAGWLREESEILGADFPHRWRQTREYIAAMRELWTKDEAAFEGRYVTFSPVRLHPKPKQKSGPPILIGSKDRNALRWVAQWGDGWCPIFLQPEVMRTELRKLREECDKAGTSFDRLDISIFKRELRGNRSDIQKALKQYEDAGVHRFILMQIGGRLDSPNYSAELERLASLYV
jgi:probable F420-dependent oxidoreductase